MAMRIGKVTKVDSEARKVTVLYEDTENTSLPLSVVSNLNGIYSMPKVGDRVVTYHMDNGSSKGFVLGSYYVGNTQKDAVSFDSVLDRIKRIENALGLQ